MLSAHPMSCLWFFQYWCSLYVHHLLPMMTAKPWLVLASEKAWWLTVCGWCGIGMGGQEPSAWSHQWSSLIMPCSCLCGMNSFSPKIPSINCSEIKYMLPFRMTKEVWDNHPWSFCTCLRVCAVMHNHLCITLMYFVHFVVDKPTVLFLRFQMKSMKIGVDENGVSWESFHGIPKWSKIQLMWLKL